ncbi:glycosyltransferase family 39 protein [candidate division WWE3 bacterium]|nr:glycosyltransferase family 39 protein [candidate division WWE3 bacterium]
MNFIFGKLKQLKYELGVFLLYVFSRLPALGFDTFNTDVWKWKQRIYDFGSGVFNGNFELTIQKYHPGVTLMWIGTFAVKVYNGWSKLIQGTLPIDNDITFIFELNFLQKLLIVCTTGIVLAFIFHVLRKVFGLKYACIAIILVSLEPFYIFLSREIHLEGLMTTFMLASIVSLYSFKVYNTKFYLVVSAFFAALSVLTKSSALVLIPFTALMIFLISLLQDRLSISRRIQEFVKVFCFWLLIFIVTFFLVWPAMWVVPIKALSTVFGGIINTGIEDGHMQLYFGELVKDPGYLYYFVVFWLRSSFYLILGLLFLPFIFKRLETKKQEFVLLLIIFSIVYLIEMMIPAKKLDRYILPTMMALVLVVAFMFEWLIDYISSKIRLALRKKSVSKTMQEILKNGGYVVLIPAFIVPLILYPNFSSYYNPLAGGLKKGIFMVEPKWTFGQRELSKELARLKIEDNLKGFEGSSLKKLYYKDILREKLVVAFPIQYYSQLYPFVYKLDGWPTIDTLRQDAKQSNYFVYPVWDEMSPAFKNYNLKYRSSVYLRGVTIYNIYTRGEPK